MIDMKKQRQMLAKISAESDVSFHHIKPSLTLAGKENLLQEHIDDVRKELAKKGQVLLMVISMPRDTKLDDPKWD